MSNPEEEKMRPMQAAIQDTVHSLDIGVGQRVLRGVLLTVTLGAILLLYGGNQFSGLRYPEAMDQAQLGRNLARGEGYMTRFIRPLSMWQELNCPRWRNAMLERHPDLMNPPVYPILIGSLLFGAGACVWLVWRLQRHKPGLHAHNGFKQVRHSHIRLFGPTGANFLKRLAHAPAT